ncbi:Uncharacterised protein [Mycobacteroides abscessus subsp. abscessus]|nr:Uncharacterised protein [Mycobacteroides abscessus subsp. abscessus]
MVRTSMPSPATGGRSSPRSISPATSASRCVGVSMSAEIASSTPGSCCLTARAILGRCEKAPMPVSPSRTNPLRPAAIRRTSSTHPSTSPRMRLASACR